MRKIWCAVCYLIVQHMPFASRGIFFKAMLMLLPYAGEWAYRNDPQPAE